MFAEQADVAISVHSMLSDKKIKKKKEWKDDWGYVPEQKSPLIRHVLHVLKFYLKKGTYINVVP